MTAPGKAAIAYLALCICVFVLFASPGILPCGPEPRGTAHRWMGSLPDRSPSRLSPPDGSGRTPAAVEFVGGSVTSLGQD